MFRSGWLAVFVACLANLDVAAEQPVQHLATQHLTTQHLVVAANREVASVISPLPADARLVVLFEDDAEPYEAISSRALRSLHASLLVHRAGRAHELAPMFIERFRNHGVQVVSLPTPGRQPGLGVQNFHQPIITALAKRPSAKITSAQLQELP